MFFGCSITFWVALVLHGLALPVVGQDGFGVNLMIAPSDDDAQAICILALLRKYFQSSETLSGSVLCININEQLKNVQEQLLRGMILDEDYPWTALITNPRTDDGLEGEWVMHEKPQCYFVLVENLEDEDFDEIFDHWKGMMNWNPLAQFVVFLVSVEETDEEMTDLMVELLLIFMNRKIFNVNVIGQSEENSFYYGKTAFPYHPDNNCGNRVIAVELLDACEYQDGESEDYDDEQEDQLNTESDEEFEELDGEERSLARTMYDNNDDSLTETNSTSQPTATIEEFFRAKFEDKFPKDLSGCPLTAAFRPWEPYIFRSDDSASQDYYYGADEQDAAGNESYSYDDDGYDDKDDGKSHLLDEEPEANGKAQLGGIEYQMVQTIAERLHVNIDLQVENTNVYHLFQQLIDGEIEMIVGGIDEDPSISQFVSSSIPYHQDDLTWCVSKAKRNHGFFNFLASFQADSWFLFLLFIVTSSFAILMAQRVSGNRLRNLNNYPAIFIRMMGILVTQAMPNQKLTVVMRILFAGSFLTGFFFSNTYQSFLISTLTTPRSSHQIQTLSEIYSNRMIIMGSSENVRHLNKDGEIFKYIREKFQMCYNIVDCLNDAAENDHIAVAVSRQHSFYNPRIHRDHLFCFDRRESLYVYLVTMLLPKKYHLLHQINPIIQHIIESGHMQKWARDLDMVRVIHEEIGRVHENPFKALKWAQFQGAFAFASVLLAIASGVLILEYVAAKYFT
ncbi:uncharacterized protein Ir87a [Drosophila tropicalis]|uniref:uncharacterized protein Ir87a n=1 Tax=Drosophila tropicalis TaxID=46794 RepID=UPI0035ABCD76